MNYQTWFFDCDGVLLDSNKVKTEVFLDVAEKFDKQQANKFVDYHVKNGGISRFEKFNYFFESILNRSEYQEDLKLALEMFSKLTKAKMLTCQETKGAIDLLDKLSDENCYVVSGGAESELRDIFKIRKLDQYFKSIYGSPDTKEEIMSRILANSTDLGPGVFVGDSLYDYETAVKFNLDFIFVSQYSEFKNWNTFFKDKSNTAIINNLTDLC